MIVLPSPPRRRGGPEARLLAALAERGHAATVSEPAPEDGSAVWLVSDGFDPRATADRLDRAGRSAGRLVVLSRLGVHRDAPLPRLRAMWDLEERARATGRPTLTLRLGPLLGAESPLWARLAASPRLPRGGRKLLNPVGEVDVIETLVRALAEDRAREGWYEVAGPEAWSLEELARLASGIGARPGSEAAWEPPLAELETHRLAEAGPWLERFGLAPQPLAERARAWGAPRARSAA